MKKIAAGVFAITSIFAAGFALALFAVATEEREEPDLNLDFGE